MKLYLSSYRVPDVAVLQDLVGKPPAKTRVALIPNAKDYYAPRARMVKIKLVATYLRQLGFHLGLVDLLEYHREPRQLGAVLVKYDMLWVMGGNTFCLREAMRRSGFDRCIRPVLDDHEVVFAGESAGACVAGTELRGLETLDNPAFAEKVLWHGLNLTPHYIMPHADNPDFGKDVQAAIIARGNDPSMVVLNDNQAWVVNGDEGWKITGAVPVTAP